MVSPKEAYNKVVKANPGMSIISSVNYNQDYYVFALAKDSKNPGYDSPYYAVNKKTGEIVGFVPDDLIEYLDAVEKRSFDFEDTPDGYMEEKEDAD